MVFYKEIAKQIKKSYKVALFLVYAQIWSNLSPFVYALGRSAIPALVNSAVQLNSRDQWVEKLTAILNLQLR